MAHGAMSFEVGVTAEMVEAVLAGHRERSNPRKVSDLVSAPAGKTGRNFMCDVKRLAFRVYRGDGTCRSAACILKTLPSSPEMRRYVLEKRLAIKEIRMYKEIFPNMERLLDSYGDYSEPLWPECIWVQSYDAFILEDLARLGFKSVSKKEQMDFEHTNLVICALARFHAISASLKEHYMMDSYEFHEYFLGVENTSTQARFSNNLKCLATAMQLWGEEWTQLSQNIHNAANSIVEIIRKSSSRKSNFCVLNHGDPSANNLLFKYSPFTENVIGVRFVDFQGVYYGSCGIDLQFLLKITVDCDTPVKHLDKLLSSYQRVLSSTLNSLDYSGVIPSLDDVKEEYKNMELFGIAIACSMMNFYTIVAGTEYDFEQYNHKTQPRNMMATFESEEYSRIMKKILKPYIESNIFEI